MDKDIIIIGFSNPTDEGIALHLNKPTCLINGNVTGKIFWVSWDKIGKAIFNDYTELTGVAELNELRKQEQIKKDKNG